ncbi:CG31510 [Drosophila busckii]|uniref:CG31510 n=1 Tax=Drosophila busckii TaxID=30019 RepID=A0A0M4ERT0_DROBS|nr:CG31510 [Drosophila busckii]
MTEPVGAKDSLVNPKTSVVKPVITNNELPTITKITIVEDKRLKNNLLKIKEGCKRLIMSDKYDSSKKITFENITHHKRCSEKIQSESNLNLSSSENKTGSNLSYKNRQQSKMANLKTQPNIVRNPLNINNIKIACVPLSKLLTQTVPEEKTPEKSKLFSTMVPDLSKKKMPDQKHDDVIVIEEENLLEDMSLNSKEIISHSTSRSEESQKMSFGKSKINQDQLHQIVQVYSLFKQKKRLETPSARKSLSNLPPYQAFQNFNKSDQCRQSPYFQYDLSNNKRMSSTITNGSSMNTIVNDISANTSLSPIDSSNPSRHDKEYLRNGYNSSKQYGYQPPAYGESPMNITGPNNYRDIDYSGMNTNRTDRNPTWM